MKIKHQTFQIEKLLFKNIDHCCADCSEETTQLCLQLLEGNMKIKPDSRHSLPNLLLKYVSINYNHRKQQNAGTYSYRSGVKSDLWDFSLYS